jgi:hypothetical protein
MRCGASTSGSRPRHRALPKHRPRAARRSTTTQGDAYIALEHTLQCEIDGWRTRRDHHELACWTTTSKTLHQHLRFPGQKQTRSIEARLHLHRHGRRVVLRAPCAGKPV